MTLGELKELAEKYGDGCEVWKSPTFANAEELAVGIGRYEIEITDVPGKKTTTRIILI